MKNIRNFSIISHIDHGKSTLADRFLELTGTIESKKMRERFLDIHPLERERGITIKLQPVRMIYKIPDSGEEFTLNLIDTPGHIDFSYEVSRSLAAVEGAILIVDATNGIQAQTLANLKLALKQKLDIIPVVNKIDLPSAKIEETKEQIVKLFKTIDSKFQLNREDILGISAKLGTNIDILLKNLIKSIKPPPSQNINKPLKALIFDYFYDPFKGVIAYVRVFDGQVGAGDEIFFCHQKLNFKVLEVGYFKPEFEEAKNLTAGEIGYIVTGLKDISKLKLGETIIGSKLKDKADPLPDYQEPKPLVFASIYPYQANDYKFLKNSLERIKLQDWALKFEPEYSVSLGRGFKVSFLGMLHLEIVIEKLKRDYKINFVITPPSVEYKINLKNLKSIYINSAQNLPPQNQIAEIEEPIIELEILSPKEFLGSIIKLMPNFRGNLFDTEFLSAENIVLKYNVPLSEIVRGLYERLKSITSGYVSINYKFIGFKKADLVKLDIFVLGKQIEQLSRIVLKEKIYQEGKKLVEMLKDLIPPQLFDIPIQAKVGSKIIARETIKARRKDVTGYLYGGDVTRKMKLLEKQKRGKKKLSRLGSVYIPERIYFEIFKNWR